MKTSLHNTPLRCALASSVAAALVATAVPPAAQAAPMSQGHSQGHTMGSTRPAKVYRGVRGQVVSLKSSGRTGQKASAVAIVDHEEIPGFMRAMRMVMPFQNAADARRFKAGDKIRFDMALRRGAFLIASPRLLPQRTTLKLAKAPGMAPGMAEHHSANGGR